MWQHRLPPQTQLILMCIFDSDLTKLANIADQIHAIPAEKGYIAASSTTASTTATTPDAITTSCEQIQKLQRQLNEISEKSRRPRDFSRRRLLNQSRGRSNSRNSRGRQLN
jgi:hypothetical protein